MVSSFYGVVKTIQMPESKRHLGPYFRVHIIFRQLGLFFRCGVVKGYRIFPFVLIDEFGEIRKMAFEASAQPDPVEQAPALSKKGIHHLLRAPQGCSTTLEFCHFQKPWQRLRSVVQTW